MHDEAGGEIREAERVERVKGRKREIEDYEDLRRECERGKGEGEGQNRVREKMRRGRSGGKKRGAGRGRDPRRELGGKRESREKERRGVGREGERV